MSTQHRSSVAIPLCPSCRTAARGDGKYLCYDCWGGLSLRTRRALQRTDMKAYPRLQELYGQIRDGVPLAEIEVTP